MSLPTFSPYWITVPIGIGMFVWVAYEKWLDRRTPAVAKRDFRIEPKKQELMQEREFVDVEPAYLLKLYKDHISVQADKLAGVYVGKWMKVSGRLGNVERFLNSWRVRFEFNLEESVRQGGDVSMFFDDEMQVDRLATLKRGDQITVVGQIKPMVAALLILEKCELAEREKPAAVLPVNVAPAVQIRQQPISRSNEPIDVSQLILETAAAMGTLNLDVLFATDGENKIYLRFLPDTGDQRRLIDALLLLLYGYKKLQKKDQVEFALATESIHLSRIHSPVQHASDTAKAFHSISIFVNPFSAEELSTSLVKDDYVRKGGLSRGGCLELTTSGEYVAEHLAIQLIKKA